MRLLLAKLAVETVSGGAIVIRTDDFTRVIDPFSLRRNAVSNFEPGEGLRVNVVNKVLWLLGIPDDLAVVKIPPRLVPLAPGYFTFLCDFHPFSPWK